MMSNKKTWKSMNNDRAISPVIGTILMVAATVIIAGAVYAAVNSYNGRASKTAPESSFKAQALDSDGNGLEDTIKVTYLSGATGSATTDATVKYAGNGTAVPAGTPLSSWSPGDYETYNPSGAGAGSYFVTVLVGDSTVLDQTIQLKE